MIREARPSEYAAIGALTSESYVAEGFVHEGSGYDKVLADVETRAENAEILVAVQGDQLLGALTYCPPGSSSAQVAGPREAEFRMLVVAAAARGRGIGEELVRAVLERARAAGLEGVCLSTDPVMTTAHRLYRRIGFERTPERDWSPFPALTLFTFRYEL